MLAAELVLGLLFLHDNGIVHHEIKPINIMISAAGHAVIGEFGAARRLPPGSNGIRPAKSQKRVRVRSKYGPIVCRPTQPSVFKSIYYAPEYIQTNKDGFLEYNEAIDFWSLGVLLHEVATGYLPFDVADGKTRDSVRAGSSTMPVSPGRVKGTDIRLDDLVTEVRIVHPWETSFG